jgi:hypothetical protein
VKYVLDTCEALTAVIMNSVIVRNVTPSSPVKFTDVSEELGAGLACRLLLNTFLHELLFNPEFGGSTFLRNFC